jgi:pectate lyase
MSKYVFDINKFCNKINQKTSGLCNPPVYLKAATGGNNPNITKSMLYSQLTKTSRYRRVAPNVVTRVMGSITVNSPIMTVASTAGLKVGYSISGAGLQAGSKIQAIDLLHSSIVLSNLAVQTITDQTFLLNVHSSAGAFIQLYPRTQEYAQPFPPTYANFNNPAPNGKFLGKFLY